MAAPRQGLNPTTNSVGFTAKLVTVRSVSADGSTAIAVDRQNTQTQVSMLVQRSKGPLPAAGDAWLISQDLGMWTFAAFVGTSDSDFAAFSQVTIAPAAPTSPTVDDIWLNSADGNQVASWTGTAWAVAQFGAAALGRASVTAAQIAAGTVVPGIVNGTAIKGSTLLGTAAAPEPGSAGTAEPWHGMTLLNGWGLGSGGYAQYMLSAADGRVLVRGANIVVGTDSGGTSIWAPPSGYAPGTIQRIGMLIEDSTGSPGAETPRFDVTAAALEVWNVPGATTRVGFNGGYALD
jgi:hypothetical protein